MNETIAQIAGQRIRYYRKGAKLTLDQLAKKINKSKSTLSKYENGEISIDIETLSEIAQILNVTISQLTASERCEIAYFSRKYNHTEITVDEIFYVYVMDSRPHRNRIFTHVIEVETKTGNAIIYWDVSNIDEYTKSRYLMIGEMQTMDTVRRFIAVNALDGRDLICLNYIDLLNYSRGPYVGSLTSLSVGHFEPYTTKCLISKVPMAICEKLKQELIISKETIKEIKSANVVRMNLF